MPSTTSSVASVADLLPSSPPEAALAARLGHAFAEPELLAKAVRHRSWCAEHPGHEPNERLEFLGDAVLGLVVAEHLYATFPERDEGWLSRARSSVVRASALAEMAEELHIGDALMLGKGEDASGGRTKSSILSDALELVCLRRKFGNPRIRRFDVLVDLGNATEFVLEVHEGSFP